jgi:hypothetical protein
MRVIPHVKRMIFWEVGKEGIGIFEYGNRQQIGQFRQTPNGFSVLSGEN